MTTDAMLHIMFDVVIWEDVGPILSPEGPFNSYSLAFIWGRLMCGEGVAWEIRSIEVTG